MTFKHPEVWKGIEIVMRPTLTEPPQMLLRN